MTQALETPQTVIVSDIHLMERPMEKGKGELWKKFKSSQFHIDRDFACFLDQVSQQQERPIELVLNGDIFDFDSVMALPEKPVFPISWLEKKRGLSSEELKSCFKIKAILDNHPIWVDSLKKLLSHKKNRIIFIIGNHDMELHWPAVQQEIAQVLGVESINRPKDPIVFCEWFYISNGDTLIEHGNQYDDYCCCANPIHPLIQKGQRYLVRLPFGNLAGRFMLNGMGLMNPNVESSFIKESVKEYMVFFFRYVLKVQPFIIWTWFWGAIVTMVVSISEGLLPPLKDPLTLNQRVAQLAKKAKSDPATVRALMALHSHPAVFNPFQIMRELWLDRALFLVGIFFFSFQLFSFFHLIGDISGWWFVGLSLLFIPPFVFYAQSVESDVYKVEARIEECVSYAAKLARVDRVVMGHTHRAVHKVIGETELLNTGTWSPAFHDAECTQPYGRKCFVWIRGLEGEKREANLYVWENNSSKILEKCII